MICLINALATARMIEQTPHGVGWNMIVARSVPIVHWRISEVWDIQNDH